MTGKLFTLEALAAKEGDCLLLHWGDPSDPSLMLIDGGPPGVYRTFLRKRLDELRASRGQPLKLDHVMVSHVDSDHIAGILDLTGEMDRLEEAGRDVPYEIDEIWFNAFDDVLGNVEAAAFRANGQVAALRPDLWHMGAAIASVNQGRTLRDRARRRGLRVNGGDTLIRSGWIWDLTDGLELHVIGPLDRRVDELQAAWDEEVRRNRWDVDPDVAAVAEYLDDSPYNLGSIVVYAKLGSRTILLTGDARGDDVLDGLRDAGILTGNSILVDVLKVPHHGSDNNVKTDFFRTVRAHHYVISGDGKHHNPEVATLEMIVRARGRARYTVHMTYRDTKAGHKADLDAFLNGLSAASRRKFVFRDPDRLGLRIDLGERLRD